MSLKKTLSETLTSSLNRYRLDIPSCTSPLDVEEFSGRECMSALYLYTIRFTSVDHDISAEQLLNKSATLSMGTGSLAAMTGMKVIHGTVTHFRRISGSADQSTYQILVEPFFALLGRQFRTHRFFVNKSVPEVVEQVLQEHGLHGWEYEFNLKQNYPKREQINQYQESDLTFIQRLLAEVGIFYWFTLQEDTQSEVVHFADAQRALMFGKTLPVNSPSGMSDSGTDSVWGLNISHNVVEANVTTKDYNHRDAQSVLQSAPADMTRGDGEGMTYGEVYHYRLRHLERGDKIDPQAETANFYARLDHERFLADQTLITAASTDSTLSPAQVLTITDSLPPTLPETLQAPVLIVSTHFTASRKDALRVDIIAVPYSETLCWRPPLLPRPKVTGTMTARVTSAKANDIYAWQDASGLYRVKFDADRDDKSQGQESMPVRLAKPYGGDVYGFHFPLIQGTEVAIAFHEGDPDRPYIAHALHDSRHVDPVTEKNSTRNVIRTPANNKLRMEDKRGEEHVKLSTEYGGKTQLNLGHNVDAGRTLRGEGFELRTDSWGAIRGGKGLFITADAQSLTFNPAFIRAVNTLSHLSDVVFTNGEAGLSFEIRPGTADGVMQTTLVIDSQKLSYMNQMPAWKRFTWPADTEAPGASLSWISTQAGTRQYADMSGSWGWIRLLDKASVTAYPGTGSSWSLSWRAQDGRSLNYTLRTEAGEGPLALLKLRNFSLPEAIFSVNASVAAYPTEDEGNSEERF